MSADYENFLAAKAPAVPMVGFEPGPFTRGLFPWQEAVVGRALRAGRHALFEDCGLGKTIQALEFARQVAASTGGSALILTPLAVAAQFEREGEKFGIECRYAGSMANVAAPITVTNYERLDRFDTSRFAGVVLDESGILKAYVGKVKQAIVDAFASTRFRLACTATPAPNDVMERSQAGGGTDDPGRNQEGAAEAKADDPAGGEVGGVGCGSGLTEAISPAPAPKPSVRELAERYGIGAPRLSEAEILTGAEPKPEPKPEPRFEGCSLSGRGKKPEPKPDAATACGADLSGEFGAAFCFKRKGHRGQHEGKLEPSNAR